MTTQNGTGNVNWEGLNNFVDGVSNFWRNARLASGLTRIELAAKMGVDLEGVAALETGWWEKSEMNRWFLTKFATAVGKPELYDEFLNTFFPDPAQRSYRL